MKSGKRRYLLKRIFLGLILMCALEIILRTYFVVILDAPPTDMSPTLMYGDKLLSMKNMYASAADVKRGDIVNFTFSVYDLPPLPVISRVVGIPGDRIEIVNKVLLINGVEQPKRRENIKSFEGSSFQGFQETVDGRTHETLEIADQEYKNIPEFAVKENSVFVLSDYRNSIVDSRTIGAVPFENIKGKITRVLYHYNPDINPKLMLDRTWLKVE